MRIFGMIGILLMATQLSGPAAAHPGRTAADGCHYCRTNCEKWGEEYGARHCHGRYQEGDQFHLDAHRRDAELPHPLEPVDVKAVDSTESTAET